MPNSTLRNLLFLAVSVLAGLLIAVLAIRTWPQLVRDAPSPAAVSTARNAPLEQIPAATSGGAPATTDGPPQAADPLAAAVGGSFAGAVRASAPAVVSIYTRRVENVPATPLEQLFGNPLRQLIQKKLGSGVIVDSTGHIVTNYHVISRSEEIAVTLADGRTTAAKLVGSDPDTDLAVLRIDLPQLPVMKLGRSDRVAVGDIVLAIGNPFGRLAQTVTHGIVSATGRADLGVATFEDFIQTDAAINDGNSGGALVNTRGELVGINTAVLGKDQGAEGLGVAIPVDLVRGVMRAILLHGRVIRGWIGIDPKDVSVETARYYGLPHAGVAIRLDGNSPAAAAGLMLGDMIEAVDGQDVMSAQDVRARIADHKPGSKVRVAVDRGTRRIEVEIPVVEAPRGAQQ
jgi:serine protease DegS